MVYGRPVDRAKPRLPIGRSDAWSNGKRAFADAVGLLFVLRALQDAVVRGVQVIVTTHSPWLLDHIELGAIIHVRREQGATVYQRFADREAVQRYADDIPPGTRFVNEVG